MNIVIIGTTNNETSQISFGRPIESLINIFQVWKCFFNSANICVVLCFNKGKSLRHRHILIGIHKDQYLFKQMYFLQLNQIIMREGYQKFENSRRRQSEESSSLQFLSSDKQAEQNILMDEQNSINIISERRKRQWLQPVVQRNQNGYKKKQKSFEEQNNSIQSTFLYKPGVQLPNLFNFTNQTIKVIIASEYINKDNPSFIRHKVYGTDTYSSNSDCVCIGIHYGLFHFTTFSYKKYEGVEITFKVIKPKKNYVGTLKNGLQSENMKNYNGNSLKPESCKMLNSLGSIQSLQKYAANMHVPIGKARTRPRPNKLSSILPMPDSNLVFNMNNQPAYKYSIENIADKGFDKTDFMTRKLDFKVLYLETESKERYELLKYVQKTYFEAYRFSKLKNPLKFDNEYFSIHPSPLDTNDLEILQSLIQWDEITFGTGHVRIKDRKIQNLISFKYYTKQQK